MEDIGVAKGYIELDISKMSSAVSQATKELKQIDRQGALAQSELNKLEAVSKGTGNMFQQMAARSKTLTAQINDGNQKVAAYQKGIANLNTVVKTSQREQQALGEKIAQAKDKLAQSEEKVKSLADAHKAAQQAISAAAKEYEKDSEEYKKVVEANQDAIAAYEKATQAVREQENGLTQLEVKYQSLGAQIDESRNQIVDYETAVNNTEAAISKMRDELAMTSTKLITVGDAIEQAGGKIQLVGGKISSVGNTLTAGVTTPIIGAGTAATKFAMDAETSYAKVSTIIDDTVVSYDDLKKSVVAASNESGVAVTDFNEALYSAISASVDSGSAIQFTTDMVKLAKGGFTDTAKAVDVVTTVLNAYGLEASQATAISDKLITTQNLGKTTVDELASSLGRVIPTANSVNVDIDNVSAAMAALTKNGIATAEATTYYNSMLNELGKSGTTADKALQKLTKKGFAELIASGVPMTEILGKLDDYAKKSGKSLSDMFGSAEASKAALTIMKGNGEEYNEILAAMKDSAGATQAAFEKMDATPAAKMQKELNKLKNAGITAGEKLIPIATKAMTAIGKLADKFSELTPEQQESILMFAGIAAAAGPVIKIIGSVTTGIGKLTEGFGKITKGLGEVVVSYKAAKMAQDGFSAGISSVGSAASALPALLNPVGLAIGGVTAVFGGLMWAMNESNKAAEAWKDGVIDAASSFAESLASWPETVAAATSTLDGFNASVYTNTERISGLETQIDKTQQNVVGIAQKAAAESRAYTDKEREEIEKLIGLLQAYTEEKMAAYQKQTEVLRAQISLETEMNEQRAAQYVATAQETMTQTIALAQTGYAEQIAAAQEAYGAQGELDQEAYNAAVTAAKAKYDEEVALAQQAYGDTVSITAQKYAEQNGQMEQYANQVAMHNYKIDALNKELAEAEQSSGAGYVLRQNQLREAIAKEQRALEDSYKHLEESGGAAWVGMVADAEMYGGNLTEDTKITAKGVVSSFENLPGELTETSKQAFQGMISGMEEKEPSLFQKAANIADGIIGRLNKIFQIASPSKVMRKLFGYVMQGAEIPLDEGEKTLPKKMGSIAEAMIAQIKRLEGAGKELQHALVVDTPKFGNLLDFDAFSSPNWRGTLRVQNDDMIDYGRLAAALAGELRANPIMVENHLDNTTVVDLDSEVIARKTEPKISRIMARKTKLQDS